MNTLPVYDYRYIKTKIKVCGDTFYTMFCNLDVLEDCLECESFTFSSVDSLLVYESRYYLQVSEKQITDYLDDNLFETDKN